MESTTDTLTDKNLITLTATQFLIADEDESRAISRLIHTIGQHEACGAIAWWVERTGQTFLEGADCIATLEGWLATRQSHAPTDDSKGGQMSHANTATTDREDAYADLGGRTPRGPTASPAKTSALAAPPKRKRLSEMVEGVDYFLAAPDDAA